MTETAASAAPILSNPPRAVRPVPAIRRKRAWGTAALALVALIGLLWLGIVAARRLSLVHHAVWTSGRVADHRITPNRAARFTLFVELPPEWGPHIVAVDVDPETYDHTWIGDQATFYLDATDPANTSEDPPSALKLTGFVGGLFFLGGLPLGLLLLAVWDLEATQKEERRILRDLPHAELTVTKVLPVGDPPNRTLVSGPYTDAEGKVWNVRNLPVPGSATLDDKVTLLYDHETKTLRALASFTAFEPAGRSDRD